MLESGDGGAKDVGLTGVVPDRLPLAITDQGDAVDISVRVQRYDDRAEKEAPIPKPLHATGAAAKFKRDAAEDQTDQQQ